MGRQFTFESLVASLCGCECARMSKKGPTVWLSTFYFHPGLAEMRAGGMILVSGMYEQ